MKKDTQTDLGTHNNLMSSMFWVILAGVLTSLFLGMGVFVLNINATVMEHSDRILGEEEISIRHILEHRTMDRVLYNLEGGQKLIVEHLQRIEDRLNVRPVRIDK